MIRTRIAPSPTGDDLHIGNLYTALFNWAFAKKGKGKFIIRIEDTDRKRLVMGSEERILQTLKRFGIIYDESVDISGPYAPYRQSERLEIYRKYAEELVQKKHAYYCFCTPERLDALRKEQQKAGKPPKYDKDCLNIENPQKNIESGTPYVIRLNVPQGKKITFHDEVRGDITIDSDTIDDQVLIKSDGYPTYHLAVVVDDHLMKITHVLRGEEWIASTPKHILLYDFFGWKKPVYAHLPLLRNPDRSKLSKRKNPVWSSWYLEKGYLPEAILNYLALLGWSHPEEKEIFSKDEMARVFDLKRISTVGPIFDITKLTWMNGEYIRALNEEKLSEKLNDFFKGKYHKDLIRKTVPLIHERIKTLDEFDEYCEFFIKEPDEYEEDLRKNADIISKIVACIEKIEKWKAEKIGEEMQNLAKEEGISFSKFFMILRIALTGKKITPPLNESMEILGKEECLKRIRKAVA